MAAGTGADDGDILVLYSVCGMLAYFAWRWSTRKLLIVGIALLFAKLAIAAFMYLSTQEIRHAGTAPDATAAEVERWRAKQEELALPTPESQLESYRGSYTDALEARIPLTVYILTVAHPLAVPDARFNYGPLEWLWRSLSRGERRPFVKAAQMP